MTPRSTDMASKVIAHYQAVCPYCKGVLKYEVFDNGKKKMLNQCNHFYRFRGEHLVSFCTTQEVQAEEDV